MVIKTVKSCILLKVISVSENATAVEVAKKLHQFQERRIFVTTKKNIPIGIISLVDINDRVVAKGKDAKKIKAKDIMSYPLNIIADINEPLHEVIKRIVQKDTYYVPVVDKGILKGLLTYANLMKEMRG